ncbi:MAG: T9SS type A sorting domain-containing protein [Ignavibacteria bacterium]
MIFKLYKLFLQVIVLFEFILNFQIYSQGIVPTQQIYRLAPINIQKTKSFQREKWFYEQRLYPYTTLPPGAYINALTKKQNLTQLSGFLSKNGFWINLGPTPGINPNYGYVSSRIASVRFNPLNPNIIYAGTACGGIWKTTNAGLTWMPMSDFEVSLSSGALAIDPNDPQIIYLGTGEATYFSYSYYGRGLLKSTDGGESWTSIRNGLPEFSYFSRLLIKPQAPSILFAALGTAGLYKSTDAGLNWVSVFTSRCDDIVTSPDGSKVFIIGSGTGYQISTDGGQTFTQYTPFALGTRNHIAICKSKPQVLYVSIYRDTTVYVYKSTNGGYNFTYLPNTFTGTNQAWYDFYIYVNPIDENNAYVGLVDLWRTIDGNTFQRITNSSSGPVHVDHHNLDFHPTDPSTIIISNDGGLNLSTNRGTNWTNLNSTFTLTQFYRIASDPDNPSHLIGGTQDNGVQRTTGAIKWDVVFGGDGGAVCFNPREPNIILSENQFNNIRRSTNGGISWQVATTGLTGNAEWIAPIIAHPDSSGIFYTGRQQVFKTTNNGASWFQWSTGISGTIRVLAISKSDPRIIFASSSNSLFKSGNGGKIFSYLQTGLPDRIITGIDIHPDSPDVAILGVSGFGTGHIFKTSNGGYNWIDISNNLPNTPVNDVMIYHPGVPTGIYLVATDVGVFATDNYGQQWFELAQGLPNTVCLDLDYNLKSNKIRVATHGRGVWEFTGSISFISQTNIGTPEKSTLFQNYPNPFNSYTKIEFTLAKSQNVKLSVHDIVGKTVEVIINKNLASGHYKLNFFAVNLPSSIYFLRLQTEEGTFIKVLVLIK